MAKGPSSSSSSSSSSTVRPPLRGLRRTNRLLLALSSAALLVLGRYALTASAVSAGGSLPSPSSLPSWWPGAG